MCGWYIKRIFNKQDVKLNLLHMPFHFYSEINLSCIHHYDFKNSSRTNIVSSRNYAGEYERKTTATDVTPFRKRFFSPSLKISVSTFMETNIQKDWLYHEYIHTLLSMPEWAMSSFVSSCWPIFSHILTGGKRISKSVLKESEGQVMVERFLHGQDKIKTSLKGKETWDREPKFKIKDTQTSS
jgi:hypothetical protein